MLSCSQWLWWWLIWLAVDFQVKVVPVAQTRPLCHNKNLKTKNWIHLARSKFSRTILLMNTSLATFCYEFTLINFSSVRTTQYNFSLKKKKSCVFDTPTCNSANGLFLCNLSALNILQLFYADLYFYTLEGIFCTVSCTVPFSDLVS